MSLPYSESDYLKLKQEVEDLKLELELQKKKFLKVKEEAILSEELLRQQEHDLRESQRIAHVGSWRLNIESNEVSWTEELYHMYGFDPSMPPPPYTEHMKLFTAESWEMLSTALEKTRLTGIPYTLELETVRKDGSNGWMWVRGEADVDSNGTTISLWGAAQDITNRKKTEITLKETLDELNLIKQRSEAENRAIIQAMPDLLFRIDRDGKYLDSHSINEASLLVPKEVFIGKKLDQILPPDLARQSMQAIEEAFLSAQIVQYEYSLPVHGNERYFENRIIAISDQEVLSIIRDITDRKTAETGLQEALRKLTTLIGNMQAGTLFEDENRKISLVNQSFCSIFNLDVTPDQLIGYDCVMASESSKVIMKDPDGFIDKINQILEKGEIVVNDELHLKDGRVLERDYIPIKQDNKLLGHLWQYRDITSRKLLFQELANEKRRFADIIKGTNVGTWEWNIQTGETIFNEQWAEILGYTLEEISPVSIETWKKFAHPEDLVKSAELLGRHFSGEVDYYSFEARMKHKNGDWIWVLDRGRVHEWDRDGKPLHMSGTHQDINEQKRTESALIAAKNEADKANRAKSDFLSRMSHELRTPMNSILGFSQLLEMSNLEANQRKGVKNILNNGKHLLDLINEVLDIAGIESGRQKLSYEPLKLSEIIVEVVESVHFAAQRRKIEIDFKDAQFNQHFILADKVRLKQILINLLNNAIKYNRELGSIRIQTSLCSAEQPGSEMVRISISDTGFGISADDIGKLFQPFERIGAEKTSAEGTGLGLMVVKKLVEAMKGKVGVESRVGSGSTFWVELPLADEPEPELMLQTDSNKLSNVPGQHSGTILCIEDNLSNIELLKEILSNHRPYLRLVTSFFGKQALELAKKEKPILVLLDLDLPDISGMEVLNHLLADAETKDIPVVVISADAMPYQVEKLINAGAKDYLVKPLDVFNFLMVVDRY